MASKGNDGDISKCWCAKDGSLNLLVENQLRFNLSYRCSEVMWEFDGKTYGYTINVSPDNVYWSTAVNKGNNTSTS